MSIVYLNGAFVAHDRAAISVDDRGFVFGDGIYDVVRVVAGRLFEWDAHAERLLRGLAGLRIELGADRVAALAGVCDRLVHDNQLGEGDASVYIAVTRGAAPRTHHFPPPGTPPTVFVNATRFVERRELKDRGCKAITAEDIRWARCDWKTLNLLGTVLARQAAAEAGAYEAILVRDGIVTEGAASTVFAVVDGVVRTHPLSPRILPSVTRKVVMACADELSIAVREAAVTDAELRRADEIFLCGTGSDVMPAVVLDGAPVGGGQPGPIAARLRAALDARLYGSRAR